MGEFRQFVGTQLERMGELGGTIRGDYDVVEAIEQLQKQLEGLGDAVEFINSDGWQHVKRVLLAQTKLHESSIITLAKSPLKYEKELIIHSCMKECFEQTVKIVDEFIKRKKDTLEALETHKKSAGLETEPDWESR